MQDQDGIEVAETSVTVTGNATPDTELFGLRDTVVSLTPEVLALYRQRFGSDGALTVRGEDDDLESVRRSLATPGRRRCRA